MNVALEMLKEWARVSPVGDDQYQAFEDTWW